MHPSILKIAQIDFLAFARLALRDLDGTEISDD
jgi:hypothetical protein